MCGADLMQELTSEENLEFDLGKGCTGKGWTLEFSCRQRP